MDATALVTQPKRLHSPRTAQSNAVLRHFLLLFLPLAVLVIVVAAIVDAALIRADLERLESQDMALVRVAGSELISELRPSQRHLRSLPSEDAIRAAIDNPTPALLEGMAFNFITLLQRNPTYDQARWIDETGLERVRVDRGKYGADPKTASAAKLQDKSSHSYFQDASRLEIGGFYVSELNLNVENGKIEIPLKPTLRVAAPVADGQGVRRGIIIINILMGPSLEHFLRLTGGRIMLINRRGEWMYGPDADGQWGYRFEPDSTMADRFPAAWARIKDSDAGQFIDNDGLWSWDLRSSQDFGLPGRDYALEPHWLSVHLRPIDDVKSLYSTVLLPSLMVAAPLLLLLAIMCRVIAIHSKQQRDALAKSAMDQAKAEAQKRRIVEMERVQKHIATLAAIVESSDDAIISKNLDSIITSWNPGAQRLFGYRVDEVIGNSMTLLFPAGSEYEEREIITRIAAGETVKHFDGRRRHKDGTLIDVSITISPIHDTEGRVIGASQVARDITESKRQMKELAKHREHLEDIVAERTAQISEANSRLESALADAEAASLAKSRFLANMSHEIRTPMNAVLGFLGLVLESHLPDTARRQLTTAHNSAKSLLLLLNGILDLSKLQSDKIELEHAPFNLHHLLSSSLDMLQIKAQDKKLDVHLCYPPDMAHCYVGDSMRIRQIVINLVGNAIKFTDSGSVTLAALEGDEPGLIELLVRDTGIGMTAEQIERIFTPFVQADTSTTRRYGGTGLGVSICKQLAEIMGGRIWVESRMNVGSNFHVSLKLEPTDRDDICSDETFTGEAAALSRRRFCILLVDDIEENVELAEVRLRCQGHQVVIARNGLQAVEAATAQDFDLILMDIHMPEMNGLDATREIRRRQRNVDYQIPIIALTASVLLIEQQQCFAAGMNAFTGKPIDFSALFTLIETIVPPERGELIKKTKQSAIDASCSLPSLSMPSLPGIDIADGVLRWGSLERYTKALVVFSAKYADICSHLSRLHGAEDWSGAYELAHSLKGVSGNMALTQIAQIATSLNDAFKARQSIGIDAMLSELADSLGIAAASISSLQMAAAYTDEQLAAAIDEPESPVAMEGLRNALESDDPGIAEEALNSLAAFLPAGHVVQLRKLIGDFEFDTAKTLLEHWAKTTSSQTIQ